MPTRSRNKRFSDVPKGLVTASRSKHERSPLLKGERLKSVLVIAEEKGLLRGTRTKVVRGRMPEALVTRAKQRAGVKSDTDLLELALASSRGGALYAGAVTSLPPVETPGFLSAMRAKSAGRKSLSVYPDALLNGEA